MKKIMDKLKSNITINKNLIIFLLTLIIIGIVSGSIFSVILNENDKILTVDSLNKFIESITNNKIDYINTLINSIVTNLSNVIIIWLLGISIIGTPIIIFMYFSKAFVIGFSVASFITNFGFKGVLYSIFYLLPGIILLIIALTILVIYAISLSMKLLFAITKKKSIDFKPIINKYLFILIIVVILMIVASLIETFILPNIFKIIIFTFK